VADAGDNATAQLLAAEMRELDLSLGAAPC
jgi:hypothetical protein